MDWCILRCSGCKTLELAASLNETGFEAWAPVETIVRRARQGAKPEPVQLPLTASYVFAPAARMLELLALSRSPALNYRVWDPEKRRMVTRGHPYFRMHREFGELAIAPDAQLAALRKREGRTAPKPDAEPLVRGTRVRLREAGFEGLWATVEDSRKSRTVVTVDGWPIPVDFPTWSVRQGVDEPRPVHVNGAQTEQAPSAKAA